MYTRGMQVAGLRSAAFVGLCVLLAHATPATVPAQDGEAQQAAEIKRKRLKDRAADFWIYDDIDAGYAQAATTGKPLLVSFRCVP